MIFQFHQSMRPIVAALLLCGGAQTWLHGAPVAQLDDFRPEDHLNPTRSYVRVVLVDETGRPTQPAIQFAVTRDLRTLSAVRLTREGFLAGTQPVCVWKPATPTGSVSAGRVLVSAAGDQPCPDEVPIKSFASSPLWLFIEIERLDGFTAEMTFRGRSYYFSVRSFVGGRWERAWNFVWPRATPALAGGVDVPRLFRPRTFKRASPVVLRKAPSVSAPVLTHLSSLQTFEHFSIGAGTLLAAVYERSSGWSRLRLIDGRTAWLAPADSGKFVSFERLAMRSDGMSGDWGWAFSSNAGGADRKPVAHDPRRRWIGYLVPGARAPMTTPVFASPDRTRLPIGHAGSGERPHLAMVDTGGNAPARAIVFSRRPGWLEVGLEGTGESYRMEGLTHAWIEDVPGRWVVHSVDARERERLLTLRWGAEARPAATVHEVERVHGVLWLRVTVFAGEPCEHALYDLPRIVLGEGWLPAHDRFGRPVVWFETYCD
jgi:hypothetical protein